MWLEWSEGSKQERREDELRDDVGLVQHRKDSEGDRKLLEDLEQRSGE